jgi:hypothetical protein
MPDNQAGTSKISDQFVARLDHLKPQDIVRAIVLLKTAQTPKFNRETRKHRVRVVKDAAERAVVHVDVILQRHKGQRLAERPDALGSVAVETTPAGIRELAASEYVKAIFEDQPLTLVQ